MAIVDQEVKRRYSPEVKIQAFWLNEVEKCKTEVEAVSLLIRELVRVENLLGTASVLIILNLMVTIGMAAILFVMSFGDHGVDSSQASKAFGTAKGLVGAFNGK